MADSEDYKTYRAITEGSRTITVHVEIPIYHVRQFSYNKTTMKVRANQSIICGNKSTSWKRVLAIVKDVQDLAEKCSVTDLIDCKVVDYTLNGEEYKQIIWIATLPDQMEVVSP